MSLHSATAFYQIKSVIALTHSDFPAEYEPMFQALLGYYISVL